MDKLWVFCGHIPTVLTLHLVTQRDPQASAVTNAGLENVLMKKVLTCTEGTLVLANSRRGQRLLLYASSIAMKMKCIQ